MPVQSDARGVLGEDAGLEGPDPCDFGAGDEGAEQGSTNAAAVVIGVDVDAVLGDAGLGAAIRHR